MQVGSPFKQPAVEGQATSVSHDRLSSHMIPEVPRPSHVTVQELTLIRECLTRWRNEVESSVSGANHKVLVEFYIIFRIN